MVLVICAGEAEYVNDIQPQAGELFGAMVLTTVGNATLRKIDATEALVIKIIKLKSPKLLLLDFIICFF